MYCVVSLPRASSIAVYSWILESVATKYPEYNECANILLGVNNARVFKNVVEMFEEINYSDSLYESVQQMVVNRNGVENALLRESYWYSDALYQYTTRMFPTPIVSIKLGKTYNTLNRFLNDSRYKTITLARRDIKQQFLSFIVAANSNTFHGNPEEIYRRRNQMNKIYIKENMFILWFDWLCRLHRAKQLTDYTFYIEDYKEDPGKLLRQLDLPEIKNYSKIVTKTIDTNFINKIANLDEFEKIWDIYCTIYKDIL